MKNIVKPFTKHMLMKNKEVVPKWNTEHGLIAILVGLKLY